MRACLVCLRAYVKSLPTLLGCRNFGDSGDQLYSPRHSAIHVRTFDGLINARSLGEDGSTGRGTTHGSCEVERELIRERTLDPLLIARALADPLGDVPGPVS